MNSIQLSYRIGNIDDALIMEAEKSTYRKNSSRWQKIIALAACIMLIAGSAIIVPKLIENYHSIPLLTGEKYLSVNDIPVRSSSLFAIESGILSPWSLVNTSTLIILISLMLFD